MAQKTYRLLLTKYLTSLRQANTSDMVRVVNMVSFSVRVANTVSFSGCVSLGNIQQPISSLWGHFLGMFN